MYSALIKSLNNICQIKTHDTHQFILKVYFHISLIRLLGITKTGLWYY